MRRAVVVIFSIALLAVVINPLVASACGGGDDYPPPPTRFTVGMHGMVAYTASGDPLRVREQPGLSGAYLTQLYNGARFTVIGGSQPIDNYVWWQIVTDDGKVIGWVAEGEYDEYYIQPLSNGR